MIQLVKAFQAGGDEPLPDPDQSAISYRGLRRCVGIVGFALPFVLLVSVWTGFVPQPMPGSISAFYYTRMGPYFIGSLCALGVFLFSYRYALRDNVLSNVASIAITFVALCPTAPAGVARTWWNRSHLGAAGLFFIIVAVFCAFMFTRKPGQKHFWDSWKRWASETPEDKRDWVYKICALLTLAIPAAAIAVNGLADQHLLFWGEAGGVIAFSFAWLVKGQMRWLWRWALFPDPPGR
jgi:hypothetical protein